MTKRWLGGLVLAAIFATAPAIAASKIVKVAWDRAGSPGDRALLIVAEAAPASVAVTTSTKGVVIRLGGAVVAAPIPDDLRAGSDGSSAVITVPSPRAIVRSVDVSGASITVTIGEAGSALASYRIGVGDLLFVSVYKNQDLTGEYTVSPEGTIKLPLVGEVPAAGSTESDLALRMTEIFAKDFLVDPQVAVTVRTYQSQFVYVTGALSQSRRVALRPGLTMKGVLSEAGVALAPGQRIVLKRAAVPRDEAITLGDEDLDSATAPVPSDGDVVTVQERAYVLIHGEVRRPGKIPIEPGTTLLEAVALAEGLTEWANRTDVRIRRKGVGETEEIRANLKRIEDRKDSDPELRLGDLILIKRRTL